MDNNTEYITVRQYSAAANISAQAVYQRLDKDLKPYVKIIDGRKMLSAEVLKNLDATCQEKMEVDKHMTSEEKAEIQHLQQEIQDLQQQLLDKEEQVKALEIDKHELELNKQLTSQLIVELKADKEYLKSKLDAAETNISNLTAALAAAQALHGMDKQQAVIEIKADDAAAPEGEPSSNAVPVPDHEEPERQGILSRLLSRFKK